MMVKWTWDKYKLHVANLKLKDCEGLAEKLRSYYDGRVNCLFNRAHTPSVSFRLKSKPRVPLFVVGFYQKQCWLQLNFKSYGKYPPFDKYSYRQNLANKINVINNLPDTIPNMKPKAGFNLNVLADPGNFQIFTEAFDWMINAISKGTAGSIEPTSKPDIYNPEIATAAKNYKQELYEAAVRSVKHDRREYNQQAREQCIAEHGTSCAVCNLNFEATYGEIGRGYIHVHHLNPLSEATGKRKVDPVNDLIPVCPNCHAMLHRNPVPYTVKELKAIMDEQ